MYLRLSQLLTALSIVVFLICPAFGQACQPDATTLCLEGGRFRVKVSWENSEGNEFSLFPGTAAGTGQAIPMNENAGYFWFSEDRDLCLEWAPGLLPGTDL